MSPGDGEHEKRTDDMGGMSAPRGELPLPSAEGPRERNEEASPWGLVGAGVELGGVVALMALGGWWLDNHFHTTPWLTLTGTVMAIIGGFYNLYRQGKRYFHN